MSAHRCVRCKADKKPEAWSWYPWLPQPGELEGSQYWVLCAPCEEEILKAAIQTGVIVVPSDSSALIAENSKLRAEVEEQRTFKFEAQDELDKLKLQIEDLKNQRREEKERADHNYKNCKEWEEHWKNAHAETIKVEAERDAANRLNGELREALKAIVDHHFQGHDETNCPDPMMVSAKLALAEKRICVCHAMAYQEDLYGNCVKCKLPIKRAAVTNDGRQHLLERCYLELYSSMNDEREHKRDDCLKVAQALAKRIAQIDEGK